MTISKRILSIGMLLLLTICMFCSCDTTIPTTQTTAKQDTRPVNPPEKDTRPVEPPQKDTVTLNLVTQKRTYDISGVLISIVQCSYDEHGLLLSEEREDFKLPTLNEKIEYVYNEHGHMISKTNRDHTQQITRTVEYAYSYNEDGTIASVSGFFDGISDSPDLYLAYDNQGRLSKATTPYFDGTQFEYFICQYGENQKLSNITVKVPDYQNRYSFQYDSNNHLLKVDTGLWNLEYKYDQFGNLLQQGSLHYTYAEPDGVLISLVDISSPDTTYVLDEQGRIASVQKPNGMRTEYEYITFELSADDFGMSRKYLSTNSLFEGWEMYHIDILAYLLPKAPHIFI